jgi:hypothetical protein
MTHSKTSEYGKCNCGWTSPKMDGATYRSTRSIDCSLGQHIARQTKKDAALGLTLRETPVQIDTKLAELYYAEAKAEAAIESAEDSIHYAAKDRRVYGQRGRQSWKLTFAEAKAKAEEIAANETIGYIAQQAIDALAEYDEKLAAKAAIRDEARPLNEEFVARGGWHRAFMVADGHVHSSMYCSTCNKGRRPTRFAWMVEYSGKDEAEIVEAAGWRACTVCYPSAPVGVTTSKMETVK